VDNSGIYYDPDPKNTIIEDDEELIQHHMDIDL
jgi:hypothetical protein